MLDPVHLDGGRAVRSGPALRGATTVTSRERAGSDAPRGPFYALMCFTFVLFVAPQSLFPALAPLRLALVSAMVAGVLHVAHRLVHRRPLTVMEPEVRLMLVLVGLAALSVPTSYSVRGSVETLVDLFGKSVIVFLLLANLITTAERFRAMVWLLTLASGVAALGVINNYVQGDFMGTAKRLSLTAMTQARVKGYFLSGLTANPNDVALALNIVVPLALGLLLATHRRWQRLVLAFIITLAVAGIIVTLSRAGFLFLLMTVFLSLGVLKRGRMWIVLLLVLALPVMMGVEGFMDRMSTIVDTELTDASSRERWETQKRAIELMITHPLLGVGIGQSVLALAETGMGGIDVHNVYLEVGVDLGVPGLIVYLFFLYYSLRSVREAKRTLRARGNHQLHHLAQGLEISLIGFLVAAMFYPIAYNFFLYYVAGLALAVKLLAQQEGPTLSGAAR
jgi:putative inorganic carbon (HCO3(-)) transporter